MPCADNEQGSPIATDLAWLAGHFDGDGWIGLSRARRPKTGMMRYSSSASIATTSERIKERVADLLTRLGVTHYFYEVPVGQDKRGYINARRWTITVRSNIGAKVFLEAIRPYLVEKGVQADLLLEYIEWRSQHPNYTGGGGKATPKVLALHAKAEEITERLRQDRWRNDPSTTTRLAPAEAG
jgi:intein/homing endonuclease